MGFCVKFQGNGFISIEENIVGGDDPEPPTVWVQATSPEVPPITGVLDPDAAASLGYALLKSASLCGAFVADLAAQRGKVEEVRGLQKLWRRE